MCIRDSRGVNGYFIGSRLQYVANILQRVDATAYSVRYEDFVSRATGQLNFGVAFLVRGGYIQENQLVGTLAVVEGRKLYRVPRVSQINKMHPLDDPAAVNVQTWDYSLCQHQPALPSAIAISASDSVNLF